VWKIPKRIVVMMTTAPLLLGSFSTTPTATPGMPLSGRRAAVGTPQIAKPTLWADLPRGWSSLKRSPFDTTGAASVWTGEKLILWGGESNIGVDHPAEGAAYDPRTNTWQILPPAPIVGRYGAGVVWTGTEMLIWGGYGDHGLLNDGAAYDPSSNTWRTLLTAPLAPRTPTVVIWTGTEMIVWGGIGNSRKKTFGDGAAYDPLTDSWRSIATASEVLNLASAVWTGRDMIVVGSLLNMWNRSATWHARALAYDPNDDGWRTIGPVRLSPQASTAAWTGSRVLVWDNILHDALYGPRRDRWKRLPRLPLSPLECYPSSAPSPRFILGWYCGLGTLFNIANQVWEPIPAPPKDVYGAPISAGRVFLLAGPLVGRPGRALLAYEPR
jgi:hypothetical protein